MCTIPSQLSFQSRKIFNRGTCICGCLFAAASKATCTTCVCAGVHKPTRYQPFILLNQMCRTTERNHKYKGNLFKNVFPILAMEKEVTAIKNTI